MEKSKQVKRYHVSVQCTKEAEANYIKDVLRFVAAKENISHARAMYDIAAAHVKGLKKEEKTFFEKSFQGK